jgi:hypothetical protein
MPKPNKEIKQLLINDFGYEPVELESYTGQLRALKETFNSLQIQNPKDARLRELAIAIKDLRAQREVEKDTTGKLKTTRKRRKDAKSLEQIQAEIDAKEKAKADRKAQKKKDAMNFISPGSAPAPLPPAEGDGGGDMSSALAKISGDVNIIRGIVEAQKNIEKDKIDDAREAREKKKRSMAENLMEGTKGAIKKVGGAVKKLLKPAEGIFTKIFDFLKLFLLGSGLMMLLDWMGSPENTKKIQSLIRFLKDFWPIIAAAVIAFFPGLPAITAGIALATNFLPKIIKLIKSIFGLGKDVDKEIAKNEKELTGEDTKEDATIEKKEETGPPPPEQQDAEKMNKGGMVPDRGNVTKMNKGGEVPGQGNTDTVPAMLTPGEFVLTKEAVNQVGADTLYNMNAAAGGVGKPSQQKPAKKKKMKTSTVGTMMNIGGLKMGGMTNNISYAGGGQVPVQNYFMGGLVKKAGGLLAKTPQARLLRFAVNQVKKLPVNPPVSKALKALKALGVDKRSATPPMRGESGDSINEIPSFSVVAPGGRAKEQTLGIRR